MLIKENQILEVLRRQNPWWRSNQVPVDLAPEFRRLPFYEVQIYLRQPNLNRAVILTGARRVGKTVLLHQLVDEFLKAGIPAKKILYITFEDLTMTQATLKELVSLYERNVEVVDKNTVILLDEIHYTTEWTRALMTALREYPGARIVGTGSAAVLLKNSQVESAAGRWVTVHVPTLSFYEFTRLRGRATPNLPADLSILELAKKDARFRESILSVCLDLQPEFNEYLFIGGFPAFAKGIRAELAQRLLREDVVDKALKRDMAHLYGARSLGQLDQLFAFLCFNSGAQIEKATLARDLGVAQTTVESHLQRLEDAHLIYRLNPIELSGKKVLRARPKIYIADPSLRNAVLLRGEGLFNEPTELGGVIESAVFKHLYAHYFNNRPRFGFFRVHRTDREVDFMMQFPDGKTLACEVKYSQSPTLSKKDALLQLVHGLKPPEWNLLITKNPEDFGPLEEGRILQIPAFLFTYLLGHIGLQRSLRAYGPLIGEAPFGQDSDLYAEEAVRELPKSAKP